MGTKYWLTRRVFDDLIGDSLIGEAKMARGLREGGIDNRIVNDDLRHD